MLHLRRIIVLAILTLLALNCTWGAQVFIVGGKNSGPNASVGSARTANIALTANVALTANAILWTGVSGRPTAVSQFTNDSVYLTATATINTALLASTANTALHVANGAITAISIANGIVGAIHVSPEVLTNNYFGNVSINGTVSLNSLAVASTTKVANLNADQLDGMDSSAFGDATAANQTTILARIGTNADAASMSSTLFAGQKMVNNTVNSIYSRQGNTALSTEVGTYTHAGAASYCRGLSSVAQYARAGSDTSTTYSDWRLPTMGELAVWEGLGTTNWLWTATVYEASGNSWLGLKLFDGYWTYNYSYTVTYVRCVR